MLDKVVIGPNGEFLQSRESKTLTVKELMERQDRAEARRKQYLAQRAKKCHIHNQKVKKQIDKSKDGDNMEKVKFDGENMLRVQSMWRNQKLKELFKPPATSEIFEKSLEFKDFTKLITDKSVIKAFDDLFSFAQESVEGDEKKIKGSARLFLAAMLIENHPSVLNTTEYQIKKKSYSLTLAFKKWELALKYATHPSKPEAEQEHFLEELRAYAKVYREWQRADMKALQEAIQAEYESSEKLLESVGDQVQWEPHVAEFKGKVGKALSSIGSSPKSEKSSSLSEDASPKDGPVPVEDLLKAEEDSQHYDDFLRPGNAQMAHDLFMEGSSFDYFKLYGQETAVKQLNVTSSPTFLLEFILKIGEQLAEMAPAGKPTHKIIKEAFDADLIGSQINSNAFDPVPLLNFTVEMISKLCAESRDHQVESLKKLMASKSDLNLISTEIAIIIGDMQKDLMNYNLSFLLPRLPSIIVQYERDAFLKTHQSNIPTLIVVATNVKTELMAGQTLTSEFLALKIFIKSVLEQGLSVETYCWDQQRLAKLKGEILDLAKKSAIKLVAGNEKASARVVSSQTWKDEPTLRIIHHRILDCLRKDISKENSISSSPKKQGIAFQEDYLVIKAKCSKLFSHNFKVFEPIYHHLSQL